MTIWKAIRKIAKLRQWCDNFCVHNSQETTFVFTIATDNFCLHYCNWNISSTIQLFTFVWTNATTAINITLLQLLTTFYAVMQLTTFVRAIAIDNFCLDVCIWGLLHAADQHYQYNVSYIIACIKTCYKLALWLVE